MEASPPWWMRPEVQKSADRDGYGDFKGETVIIVHGTFDRPRAGKIAWYQPGGTFCISLDKELEKLGSSARCWAHVTSGELPPFHWDGGNSFESRQIASAWLQAYHNCARRLGWRCHFVCHSHGGNVLVRSLQNHIDNEAANWRNERWYGKYLGEIVCLGTPFLDMTNLARYWYYGRYIDFHDLFRSGKQFGILGLAIAAYTYYAFAGLGVASFWALIALAVVSFFLSLRSLFGGLGNKLIEKLNPYSRRRPAHQTPLLAKSSGDRLLPQTHLLAINSVHDEALALLRAFQPHSIKVARSKLTLGSTIRRTRRRFRRRFSHRRAALLRRWFKRSPYSLERRQKIAVSFSRHSLSVLFLCLAALVYVAWGKAWEGVAVAAAAAFALWITIVADGRTLTSALLPLWRAFAKFFSDFCFRRIIAPLFYRHTRGKVFGLNDLSAPGTSLEVSQTPDWLLRGFCRYDPLDEQVEIDQLDKRSHWFDDVVLKMATVNVATDDIGSILLAIAADKTLIHNSYYTDSRVIGRIAKFIVSRE